MTNNSPHHLAHRFPSTPVSTSHLASDVSVPPRATTDGAPAGTTPPVKRRTPRRDLAAVADSLSERDWTILRSVAEHRFLTVSQIHALHFDDHSTVSGLRIAQRTLARLRRQRVLGTLTRRVGGIRAGSSGLVHYVDVVGDRLLRLEAGARPRRRRHEPTATFLRHTLAIGDTHVVLAGASRAGQLELLRCEPEPACWRRYTGIGGATLTLKPDLYVETASSPHSDYVDAWFVEIDLGHESIPTLLRKCHDYEAYRRSGTEQANHDVFPLVVFSLSAADPAKAERRRSALAEEIRRDRTLRPELFRIIAPEDLLPLVQTGGAS